MREKRKKPKTTGNMGAMKLDVEQVRRGITTPERAYREVAEGLRTEVAELFHHPDKLGISCCFEGCCVSWCCIQIT
jgi:hypothetical protein